MLCERQATRSRAGGGRNQGASNELRRWLVALASRTVRKGTHAPLREYQWRDGRPFDSDRYGRLIPWPRTAGNDSLPINMQRQEARIGQRVAAGRSCVGDIKSPAPRPSTWRHGRAAGEIGSHDLGLIFESDAALGPMSSTSLIHRSNALQRTMLGIELDRARKKGDGETRAARRKLAVLALLSQPQRSDRSLAALAGVSAPTIGKLRRELERLGFSVTAERRIDGRGNVQSGKTRKRNFTPATAAETRVVEQKIAEIVDTSAVYLERRLDSAALAPGLIPFAEPRTDWTPRKASDDPSIDDQGDVAA
jgi:hypothetical protein